MKYEQNVDVPSINSPSKIVLSVLSFSPSVIYVSQLLFSFFTGLYIFNSLYSIKLIEKHIVGDIII